MAKRRLGNGRWLIAAALVAFVATSAAVVARRSFGHQEGVRATELQRRISSLQNERVRLQALIREASSLQALGPIAERRLGLRVPSDTQVVFLPRTPEAPSAR